MFCANSPSGRARRVRWDGIHRIVVSSRQGYFSPAKGHHHLQVKQALRGQEGV